MRLLKLAIEMQKWDLAAHVVILGAITARQKENERLGGKKDRHQLKRQARGRRKQR